MHLGLSSGRTARQVAGRRVGNARCLMSIDPTCSVSNQNEWGLQMRSREVLKLRQRALETLQKSTRMLEMAFDLLKHGNPVAAQNLTDEARTHRTISTLLMTQAHTLETSSEAFGLQQLSPNVPAKGGQLRKQPTARDH